jgi:hypothetical protein
MPMPVHVLRRLPRNCVRMNVRGLS